MKVLTYFNTLSYITKRLKGHKLDQRNRKRNQSQINKIRKMRVYYDQ